MPFAGLSEVRLITRYDCGPEKEQAMSARPELDLLKNTKYLYLRELQEPRDNSLRLVVQEAVANPGGFVRPHPELPELEELTIGASPIESTDAYRLFELTWKRYVAYLITEECVGSCGRYDDEEFTASCSGSIPSRIFLNTLRETQVATLTLFCITS